MGIEAGLPSDGINSFRITNDITKKKKPLNPDSKAHEIALGVTQDAKELQSTNVPFLDSHNAKPINPNAEPGTTTSVEFQTPQDHLGEPPKYAKFNVRNKLGTSTEVTTTQVRERRNAGVFVNPLSLSSPSASSSAVRLNAAKNATIPSNDGTLQDIKETILEPQRKISKSMSMPQLTGQMSKLPALPPSPPKSLNYEKNGHTFEFNELWTGIRKGDNKLKDVGVGVTGSKFAYTEVKNGNEIKKEYKSILKTMTPPVDSWKRRMEKKLKKTIGQERPTDSLVGRKVEMKMIGEAGCFTMAEELGINKFAKELGAECDIVPPTGVIAHEGKLQSMQLFVPGAMEAKDVFHTKLEDIKDSDKRNSIKLFREKLDKLEKLDRRNGGLQNCTLDMITKETGLSENEISLIQLFEYFDFLTGNLDRHDENYLIKLDKNGNLVGIVAIDDGNSMPAKHLDEGKSFFIKENQYSWAKETISKIPTTPKIKELLSKITQKNVEDSLNKINENVQQTIAGSFRTELIDEKERDKGIAVINAFHRSDGVRKCFQDRLNVMQDLAAQGSPPSKMANYKTKEQFNKFSAINEATRRQAKVI